MTRRRAALAALAAGLALAGCSAGGPGPARPPAAPVPTGTGYFVGTGANGLGASVDLFGDDPVTRAVDAALEERGGPAADRPAVGIVSVVNEGPTGIGIPRFVAVLSAGGAVTMRPASEVLADAPGAAARRARARLASSGRRVPADGAATAYVVLEDVAPAAVGSVRMEPARGAPVTLSARRR